LRNVFLLIALALVGCKKEVPEKRVPPPPAKYRVPNQFVMKDGCIIRTSAQAYRPGFGYRYYGIIGVNDWSKTCAEAKDSYLETEVLEAKYH